jgi:hypothetical protein
VWKGFVKEREEEGRIKPFFMGRTEFLSSRSILCIVIADSFSIIHFVENGNG